MFQRIFEIAFWTFLIAITLEWVLAIAMRINIVRAYNHLHNHAIVKCMFGCMLIGVAAFLFIFHKIFDENF